MPLRLDVNPKYETIKAWLETKCSNNVDEVDCPACATLDYIENLHSVIEAGQANFDHISEGLTRLQELVNDLKQ